MSRAGKGETVKTAPEGEKARLRRENEPLGYAIKGNLRRGKGKTRAGARVCPRCGASLPDELEAISREAERELGEFKFPALDFKVPEFDFKASEFDFKASEFTFPEVVLPGEYSGPVLAEVRTRGAVKCGKCGGAVRVAEVGGRRFAVQSAGAPVCAECAGSLPGGAALAGVLAGVFPKN